MEHVWKKTETNFELKNVSLSILEDEWLLISGPVGEGKEVLQKVILGFDNDWDGLICLNKKNIKNYEGYAEKIAFIHNRFIEEKGSETIFDYLALPLKIKGKTEIEIRKEINNVHKQFMNIVELTKKMKDLSLQEKVSVSFLKAILMNPSLIVIDEPFYQLSNSKRKLILETFKDNLRNWKGCPVVIFSSYILEWLPFCDRIAVFKENGLLQIGEPQVLIEHPQHAFVAKYLHGEDFTLLKGILKGNRFITEGFSFLLPKQVLQDYLFFEGQELVLGMMATSFQIVDKPISDTIGLTFKAPIHIFYEKNGFYKVYSNIGHFPLVAQIKINGKINEGEQVQLFFPFDHLLFFDGNTEKKINAKRLI